MEKQYDTLVMSGGAINGIIQLGALQYCNDKRILDTIKTFVGTSVGAIICYLLIIGYTPADIIVYLCINHQIFEKLKYFDISAGCRGDGATTFLHITEYLERMTTEKIGKIITMKDIPTMFGKTFVCTTFNVTKNNVVYISPESHPDLPCLAALRMTCNLPLVFEHYKYGDSFYVDGGISNNFPLNIGEKYGSSVLGIVVVFPKHSEDSSYYPQKNMVTYALRLMYATFSELIEQRIETKQQSTDVIRLEAPSEQFLNLNIDSKLKLDLFSIGYSQTQSLLNYSSKLLTSSEDIKL